MDPDAVEGPSITEHDGWYYLFDAFDFCCRGTDSDYRVMVGRSRAITGPYVDRAGVPLLDGGGTEVLRGYDEFIGTGGADVLVDGDSTWMVNHYYDATSGGAPRLNVRPLTWTGDDWPVVGDPVNPGREVGHGDAYVQIVSRTDPGQVVENAGCGYEGSNIALWPDLGNSCQQWQLQPRGNGAWSILNRFSNKVAEVAACNNVDGGNVAQWGWLGFLPNNDCQRWTPTPLASGWTVVRSVLPGNRVLDVAGCGTAPGTNVDVSTRAPTACQSFRFAPVGAVVLASATSPSGSPVLADCGTAGWQRVSTGGAVPRCATWTFRSVGGASYVVVDSATGRWLSASACDASRTSGCAASADGPLGFGTRPPLPGAVPGISQWVLAPTAAGSWTLRNAATGAQTQVRLALP